MKGVQSMKKSSQKLKLFALLFTCIVIACSALPVFSAPNLSNLPQIILDGHPGWIDLYNKAWQIALNKVQSGTAQNGFVTSYMDEGFSANIFQWDTCFITMFGRYSNGEFPSIVSLENFYRKQRANGYICREIKESDGTDYWPYNDNVAINPPLFSWSEWQYYQISGDNSRFTKNITSNGVDPGINKTVLQRLVDYYTWIKNNRRWANGLYWSTGYSDGMDNSPRLHPSSVSDHANGSWICISAQQAMNAYYISKIAEVVGDTATKDTYNTEYTQLKDLVNNKMWDNTDGFYYDLYQNETFCKVKTPASFWPMIGRVADQTKTDRLVNHIINPAEFWRTHTLPTLSADDPDYDSGGNYWHGSVWAPTTYETIKGLELFGYESLAHDLSKNHIDQMYQVYQSTNTIWENYAPEYAGRGSTSRSDFVGWSGCGPISLLIENVLGIQVNGLQDSVTWSLRLTERHGITNLKFGNNTVSLTCAQRYNSIDPADVTVTTDSNFSLTVKIGTHTYMQAFTPGTSAVRFGNDITPGPTLTPTPSPTPTIPGSVIDISHSGTSGYSFGQASDQIKRWQTFIANSNPKITGVDVKIHKHTGTTQSNVTVELFATSNNLPTGTVLASATISAASIGTSFAVFNAPLTYTGLVNGTKYAIVLGQQTTGTSDYEWCTAAVDSNLQYGKWTGSTWTDESSIGDGWTKIYVATSGSTPTPTVTPTPTPTPTATPTPSGGTTVTFQQGSNGYTQAADAHISEYAPGINAGGNDRFEVSRFNGSYSNDDKSGLLKFDISTIPSNATVTSATVELTLVECRNGTPTKSIEVRKLNRAWGEGSKTGIDGGTATSGECSWTYSAYSTQWTNPGGDYDSTAADTKSIASTTGTKYTWNITGMVQGWVTTASSNYGIIFLETSQQSTQNGTKCFAAKEYATVASRPKLTVVYTTGNTPSPTNTPTPAPTATPTPTPAGLISVGNVAPPASANLSTDGTSDWAHWGYGSASGFNHKSGITQQISNFTNIGGSTISQVTDCQVKYSWTGGTPTASVTDTITAICIFGAGNGWQITIPAGTTQKTLKVYTSVYKSKGKFEVSLSDGSAAPYVDYTDNSAGSTYKVYTIYFKAASASQTLTVKHTVETSYTGNVTLQAATLY
jgi:hypothetical protein